MKHDIRDLFKEDEVYKHELPETHEQEFFNKLKNSNSKHAKLSNYKYAYLIAATVLLFLTFGYFVFNDNIETGTETKEEHVLVQQIEALERDYLVSINKEWESFLMLTNDENLINRYRNKLDDLDKDFQDISEQFKTNNNNILVIEALVENLKTRLELLKNIKEHVTILNQEKRTL